MFESLVITLREGLEAALIIGIILAYLSSTNNRQGFKSVWIGTALAIVASLIAGGIIYVVAGELKGQAEEIFEGSAMLLAAGVLTWMIFWMHKQAVNIKKNLHARIQSVLTRGSSFGLAVIAFLAVVREGIETVLFIFAATRGAESAVAFVIGGVLGLGLAVAMGYSIYRGTTRLNLRVFFNITGLILIIFAAGLLAQGIHEFQEAGIIPIIVEHLWDINNILPEKSTFGLFLKAIVGYNGNPSLIEVTSYILFLVVTLFSYFGPIVKQSRAKS